jgi:DNA-damage-inducible protein J
MQDALHFTGARSTFIMAKTATVNARLDAKLKTEAEAVFRALRLSRTEALRLFYRQVALRQGLPFDVCIPNEETIAAIEELEAGEGKTYRGSTRKIFDRVLRE